MSLISWRSKELKSKSKRNKRRPKRRRKWEERAIVVCRWPCRANCSTNSTPTSRISKIVSKTSSRILSDKICWQRKQLTMKRSTTRANSQRTRSTRLTDLSSQTLTKAVLRSLKNLKMWENLKGLMRWNRQNSHTPPCQDHHRKDLSIKLRNHSQE